MTTKTFVFEKFLEIIGHSNQIEFNDTFEQVYSSWMNIPKNKTFLMNMVNAATKLSKDRDGLSQTKISLTKRFPARNMIRRLRREL